MIPEFFRTGHAENVEYQFVRKDGTVFDGWLSAVLERDPEGVPLRSLAVTVDVTERNKAERQLQGAKSAAELANRAKSKFLAAASHDLRQPLQAIRLFSAALNVSLRKNNGMEAENLATLHNIEQAVDSLGSLLNALLDISKLEAGVVSAQVSAFPIQNIVTATAKTFDKRAPVSN